MPDPPACLNLLHECPPSPFCAQQKATGQDVRCNEHTASLESTVGLAAGVDADGKTQELLLAAQLEKADPIIFANRQERINVVLRDAVRAIVTGNQEAIENVELSCCAHAHCNLFASRFLHSRSKHILEHWQAHPKERGGCCPCFSSKCEDDVVYLLGVYGPCGCSPSPGDLLDTLLFGLRAFGRDLCSCVIACSCSLRCENMATP